MVASVLWIWLSGLFVRYLIVDPLWITNIEIVKGWLFVVVTAALLYRLILHETNLLIASEQKLQKGNEELGAAYEELLAAEEELRQQFDELLNKEMKISRRNECLNVLHEAALTLMNKLNVDDLLAMIVAKMRAAGGAQYGYIYLVDEHGLAMEAKIIEGFPREQIKTRVKRGQGILGKVWDTGKVVVINNYHNWENRLPEAIYNSLRTSIGIPLKIGEQVVGVFNMSYTTEHIVDQEELQMLESLAELASMALGNARLHEELQQSQFSNQALIDALPDAIFRLDHNGTLLSYIPGKDFNLMIDPRDKVGKQLADFLPEQIAQQFMKKLEISILLRTTQLLEYEFLFEQAVYYREVRIMVSGTNEVIAIVRDVTERKAMECQLQYVGLHDQVTGLYNRAYFEEELQRLNDNRHIPVGVVVCDIDGLKLVNDTFGHQAGDGLLLSAANLIRDCFPGVDVVARVGGDEFAILLPDKDSATVEQVCHSMRNNISQFRADNVKIPISISIGMSVRTSPEQSMGEVYKAADDNMYREKLHSSLSVRSAIVHTLAKALEVRDFVTDGHADRLQSLVVALAVAVGLPESELSDLRLLGRFHDIGKVGIPDHILFKSERLTDEEFDIMKRHCEIGYRIAQSSPQLAPIADWILKHQEWWNGEGYPLKLKGNEIPLACRMLAIVDAYDAMTNDRPYRQAKSVDEAIAELERFAAIQFDPELVQLFKQIIRSGVQGK
jgi:diguanylate cyclase (GGDEF)-like protein